MGRLSDLIRRPAVRPSGTPIDAPFTPELSPPNAATEAEAAAAPEPSSGEAESESGIPYVEIGGPGPALFGFTASREWPAPVVARVAAVEPLRVKFQPNEPEVESAGFAEELIAFYSPEHPASRQYRELFEDLARQFPGTWPRSLLFTSSGPASGATTVVLNLAVTAAIHSGTRVLVVDANRERPAIAGRLGVRAAPGWSEVLAGRSAAAWAIRPTAQDRLHVLTAGRTVLAGVATSAPVILDECRRLYDWVLIDGPAGAASPELLTLADACAGVYVIERQGRDGDDAAVRFREQLRDGSEKLRGVILTHHGAD